MQNIVPTIVNKLARFAGLGFRRLQRRPAVIVNFSIMPVRMYTDFREDH